MNPKKTDRHEVIAAIHRALVEIYTLKHEGLPLAMDYFAFDLDDDYARRLAEGSTFESDPHGETRVVLESEELRRQILESTKPKDDTTDDTLPQPELAAEEYTERQDVDDDLALMPERDHASPSIKRDEVEAEAELPAGDDSIDDAPEVGRYHILGGEYQIKPANDSWRNIALDDSQVKFAVSCGLRSSRLSPNAMAGTQTSYAIDRRAYSRPRHHKYYKYESSFRSPGSKAEDQEIGRKPND